MVVAAAWNFQSTLIWDEMSMQLKPLVVGMKMPTQSALYGAKTTRPSLVVAVPANLLVVPELLASTSPATQLKSLHSCRPRPEWMTISAWV